MNQLMGNLYGDHQPIHCIKAATFAELEYWNEWSKLLNPEK